MREITFIAYYLHWSRRELFELTHMERRRYCGEISDLHGNMGGRSENPFDY